jgi:hypothetical protein
LRDLRGARAEVERVPDGGRRGGQNGLRGRRLGSYAQQGDQKNGGRTVDGRILV